MNNSIVTKNKANLESTATLSTTPAVKARLDKLAVASGRSESFLTNEALLRYLADEEEFVADIAAGLAEANAGTMIDGVRAETYFRSLLTDNPLPEPKPIRAWLCPSGHHDPFATLLPLFPISGLITLQPLISCLQKSMKSYTKN